MTEPGSFQLLCRAGRILASASADGDALTRLVQLLVPGVADGCAIDVLADDGRALRAAGAGTDAALRRIAPDAPGFRGAVGRVTASGATVVRRRRGARAGAASGQPWVIIAPLAARGRVRGALTLVSLSGEPPADATRVRLAEELGRRVAALLALGAAERAVQRTRAQDGEFLGMVAHELRTPTYIVTMLADLLLMGVPASLPADARRHAQQIRSTAEHLERLIQQLLTFARLEVQRDEARMAPVDLSALARDTAALIEPLALQKQLGFVTDVPAEAIVAHTDANRVRQILFNLLGNAVKFTDEGEVRLILRAAGEHAVFEIRDTGVGIAPEHREKVFTAFWQANRDSIAGSKGTGLGLNIVHRLTQLLQGQLELDSTPNQGSVFRLRLPLQRGTASAGEAADERVAHD